MRVTHSIETGNHSQSTNGNYFSNLKPIIRLDSVFDLTQQPLGGN